MTNTPTPYERSVIRELALITTTALTHGPNFTTHAKTADRSLVRQLAHHLETETKKLTDDETLVTFGILNGLIWDWHTHQITRLLHTDEVPQLDEIQNVAIIYGCERIDNWDYLRSFPPQCPHLKKMIKEFEQTRTGWTEKHREEDPDLEDDRDFRFHNEGLHRELLDEWHDETLPEITVQVPDVDDVMVEIIDILEGLGCGDK